MTEHRTEESVVVCGVAQTRRLYLSLLLCPLLEFLIGALFIGATYKFQDIFSKVLFGVAATVAIATGALMISTHVARGWGWHGQR